jgi:hypothetical protein
VGQQCSGFHVLLLFWWDESFFSLRINEREERMYEDVKVRRSEGTNKKEQL